MLTSKIIELLLKRFHEMGDEDISSIQIKQVKVFDFSLLDIMDYEHATGKPFSRKTKIQERLGIKIRS